MNAETETEPVAMVAAEDAAFAAFLAANVILDATAAKGIDVTDARETVDTLRRLADVDDSALPDVDDESPAVWRLALTSLRLAMDKGGCNRTRPSRQAVVARRLTDERDVAEARALAAEQLAAETEGRLRAALARADAAEAEAASLQIALNRAGLVERPRPKPGPALTSESGQAIAPSVSAPTPQKEPRIIGTIEELVAKSRSKLAAMVREAIQGWRRAR